jgi:hypothetical protein
VLAWPLLLAALFVIGLLLSRGPHAHRVGHRSAGEGAGCARSGRWSRRAALTSAQLSGFATGSPVAVGTKVVEITCGGGRLPQKTLRSRAA